MKLHLYSTFLIFENFFLQQLQNFYSLYISNLTVFHVCNTTDSREPVWVNYETETSLKHAYWSTRSSDPLTVSGEFCAVSSEGSKLGSRADTALKEARVEAKGWVTLADGPCSPLLSHSINSALFPWLSAGAGPSPFNIVRFRQKKQHLRQKRLCFW